VLHADGSMEVGGRVLVVCGVTGLGRPYRTEMLVFYDGGELGAIEPIYWSGMGIGRRPVTEPAPGPADPGCPPRASG
jgi:hypothetical protein